jgi:hypothetical protein
MFNLLTRVLIFYKAVHNGKNCFFKDCLKGFTFKPLSLLQGGYTKKVKGRRGVGQHTLFNIVNRRSLMSQSS